MALASIQGMSFKAHFLALAAVTILTIQAAPLQAQPGVTKGGGVPRFKVPTGGVGGSGGKGGTGGSTAGGTIQNRFNTSTTLKQQPIVVQQQGIFQQFVNTVGTFFTGGSTTTGTKGSTTTPTAPATTVADPTTEVTDPNWTGPKTCQTDADCRNLPTGHVCVAGITVFPTPVCLRPCAGSQDTTTCQDLTPANVCEGMPVAGGGTKYYCGLGYDSPTGGTGTSTGGKGPLGGDGKGGSGGGFPVPSLDIHCGNGILETTKGEQCDDHGVVPGDGCDQNCQKEPICGDGIPGNTLGEECDDGNTDSGDGCSHDCIIESKGGKKNDSCGDGLVVFPEQCDPNADKSQWKGVDSNVCTDEGCDPDTCKFVVTNNSAPCDDGSKCTTGDVCSGGSCQAGTTPLSCDNGLFCDGTETCNPATGCVAGTAPTTDDGVACTNDACDEAAKKVVHTADNSQCTDDGNICTQSVCNVTLGCQNNNLPNGTACNDDNLCTQNDSCGGGKCSGQAISLKPDDKSDCMGPETCDPKTGKKPEQPLADGTFCNDGKMCTLNDQCVSGACTGSPKTKASNDPCIFYECDGPTGNMLPKNSPNGTVCDDSKFCTTGDVCKTGACTGGTPKDCNDSKVCTSDSCDEAGKSCKSSSIEGCCTQDSDCGDGNSCSTDSCVANKCTHTNIGSGTLNTCGGCTDLPNLGTACSAGEGLCQGSGTFVCDGTDATKCNAQPKTSVLPDLDDNPCTDDTCNNGKQVTTNTSTACEDGSACTQGDKCSNGKCVTGTQKDCDDSNACTADACALDGSCKHDPIAGCCTQDSDCGDGNSCTTDSCVANKCTHSNIGSGSLNTCGGCTTLEHNKNEACSAGEGLCQSTGKYICEGTDKTKCDAQPKTGALPDLDDNPCTDDACVNGKQVTTNTTAACEDGSTCTEGDQCSGGQCKPGKEKTCSASDVCHTAGTCDPTSGVCPAETKIAGCCLKDSDCDNGTFCDGTESCQNNKCVGGTTPTFDDGNLCTDDACDETTKAGKFTPNSASCDDGNACTEGDQCSNGSCQAGQPKACGDGDACNGVEVCQNGACQAGTPVDCDDKDKCTNDTCNPDGSCAHVKDEKISGCKPKPKETCDGFTPEVTGCMTTQCEIKGDVKVITNVPVANTTVCDDTNPCTESDKCTDGVCGGSQKACDDGKPCTTDSCNVQSGCVNIEDDNLPGCKPPEQPKDPCDGFVPTVTGCKTTQCKSVDGKKVEETVNVADGTACNDGSACTQTDACQAGACTGQAVPCDDGEKCTTDSCNPNSGCVFTPDDTLPGCKKPDEPKDKCEGKDCNDSDACTTDSCNEGECSHVAIPDCPKKDPCDVFESKIQDCLKSFCENDGVKQKIFWKQVPKNSTCTDDGKPCTTDLCDKDGACQHEDKGKDQKPGNKCLEVKCDEKGDLKESLKPGAECSQDDLANGFTCDLTNCKKFNIPPDCDGKAWDKNLGEECEETQGVAEDEVCVGCKLKKLPKCLNLVCDPDEAIMNETGQGVFHCVMKAENQTEAYIDCNNNGIFEKETDIDTLGEIENEDGVKEPMIIGNCLPTVVGTHKVTGRTKNGYEDKKPGYEGDICPETITLTASCGDGVKQPNETCDDGNSDDTDGCLKTCAPAACGDGKLDAGEVCDDGNLDNNDGCNSMCQPESCGDGIQQTNEECEDGNIEDNDKCSSQCKLEVCGDGVLQDKIGEECEDSNQTDGDGCSQQCTKELVCTQASVVETATKGVFQVEITGTNATNGCVATNNPAEPYLCYKLVEGKTTFNVNCEAPGGELQAYVASIPIQNPLMEGQFKKAACPNTLTIACEKPLEPEKPAEPIADEDKPGELPPPPPPPPAPPKPADSVADKKTLVDETPQTIDPVGTCASLDINCFSCIDATNQVRDLKANINQTTFKEFMELNNKSVTIMPNADKSVTEILIDTATGTEKNAMLACACPAPRATSLNNTKTTNNNPLVLNNLSCITAEQVKELETKPDKFALDGIQTKIKSAGKGLYELTTVKGEKVTLPVCPCDPSDTVPKTPPTELINQSPGGSVGTSLNIACFEDNPNKGIIMNGAKKGEWIELTGRPCPTESVWEIIEKRGYNALDQAYRDYSDLAIAKKGKPGSGDLDASALTELNKKFIPVVEGFLKVTRNENRAPTDTTPIVAAIVQLSTNTADIKPDNFLAENMDLTRKVADRWLGADNHIKINQETGEAIPASPGSGNAVPVTEVKPGGTGQPEPGKPDSGKPDSGKPEASKPESGKPEASKPDSGKPEIVEPGEKKETPENGEKEKSETGTTAKPDSGKPEAGKPESGKPDSGKPESGKDFCNYNGVVEGTEECDFTTSGTPVFGKIKTCSDWQAGFVGTVSCTPNCMVDTFSNCSTACPAGSTSTTCFTVGKKPKKDTEKKPEETGKPDSGKPEADKEKEQATDEAADTDGDTTDKDKKDKDEDGKKGGKPDSGKPDSGKGPKALALSVNAEQQGLATGAALSSALDPIADQAAMVDNMTSVGAVVNVNTQGGGNCSLMPDRPIKNRAQRAAPLQFWMNVWTQIKAWVLEVI